MTHRIAYILGRGVLGGVERHVQGLLQHLDGSRFEPHLVVLGEDGEVSRQIRDSRIPVTILHGTRGWHPGLAWRLWRTLQSLRPAVVHSHEMHTSIGAATRLLPGVPWVHTEHCSFDHGPSPARSAKVWRLFAPRVTRLICVSNATLESYVKRFAFLANRGIMIPNALDMERLPARDPDCVRRALSIPTGTPIIGAVGRLAWQKDWPLFVSVCELIAGRDPSIHFVIVGDGPERPAIEGLIRKSPAAGRFHLMGSRADALELIGGMDLFLCTSRHEELPTTLLEAFAMQTPVAGRLPEGGARDFFELGDVARLLETSDPKILAEAALSLLGNVVDTRTVTSAALRVVHEHYSMSVVAKRIGDEYRAVLKS